jgi:hypothetical protein
VYWQSKASFLPAHGWSSGNGSDLKCIGGEGQRLRFLARKVASWARARSEKPALVRCQLPAPFWANVILAPALPKAARQAPTRGLEQGNRSEDFSNN